MDSEELKSGYPELLRKYLFEGKEEEGLFEAYKLGKECFEAKISIDEIMDIHTQSLNNILKTIPPDRTQEIVLKSSNLLLEFSTRFGLVCQNYFEMLQRTDERIKNAFYQAGEALTAGSDIQKILSVILKLVKNLSEAACCAIILLEDYGKVAKFSECIDSENEFFRDFLFEVMKEGKVKFLHDLREEKSPGFLKDGREIRSVLALPLNFKGKTLGILGIYLTHLHHYEEKEINLLISFAYQAAVAIDNAQLFSQLQRHDKTLEALYAIDRVISQTLEIDIIFRDSLSKTLEVTGTEAGGIYVLEEEGKTLILRNHMGISPELAQAFSTIKVGTGVSGMAVSSGKPVILDVQNYPNPEQLSLLLKDGIVSIISTPLIAKGKSVGALTIVNRKRRFFSDEDIDLLASIGSQIGGAVENAILFGELERHHRILNTLYSIESVVSRSLNLEEIFDTALSKAIEVTDTEAGTLYSVQGEILRLEACEGLCPEFKKMAVIRNMGDGIPGIAAQLKKAITMDISQFPSPPLLPYMTKEGLVSFIGTPLLSKGKVVGALALGTKKKRIFTQDNLDLLFSIGNVIGIAVENARLYKEVMDKAEHISALYRIARAIKASLDTGEVFDAMVGEMRNILPFDRTTISLVRDEMVEVFALAGEIEIPELGRGTRIPRSESSSGFVLDRRAGLIRNLKDAPFYEDKILFKKGIRSVIQVPLISKGEMVGVLSIESCMPNVYTQRELGLAQAIADQIATSIENVRLYEDLKQANLELEKRLKELEDFHTLAVGRELRMMELKKRIRREEGK